MSTNQTQETPKKYPIDQPTPIILQKTQPHNIISHSIAQPQTWASSWNPKHYLNFSSYPQVSPKSFVICMCYNKVCNGNKVKMFVKVSNI
jgi:hypothetical protein